MGHTEQTDWPAALKPLIAQYRKRKHPLEYSSLYQTLVMVLLAAQDSDAHINKIAPELFAAFPDMKALSQATADDLLPFIKTVRGHLKKANWLLDIAQTVQEDKNIPVTMKALVDLKGIGRKSANVIMREAGVALEGIMVDLHVVRVATRLGISDAKDANKIEQQLMEKLPRKMWTEVGSALSFLGRETCRPTNPHHDECVVSAFCSYCREHNPDIAEKRSN